MSSPPHGWLNIAVVKIDGKLLESSDAKCFPSARMRIDAKFSIRRVYRYCTGGGSGGGGGGGYPTQGNLPARKRKRRPSLGRRPIVLWLASSCQKQQQPDLFDKMWIPPTFEYLFSLFLYFFFFFEELGKGSEFQDRNWINSFFFVQRESSVSRTLIVCVCVQIVTWWMTRSLH